MPPSTVPVQVVFQDRLDAMLLVSLLKLQKEVWLWTRAEAEKDLGKFSWTRTWSGEQVGGVCGPHAEAAAARRG